MKNESIENIEKTSLLYDFYGALLTEKQREVMELYHEENLSIVEIAEEFDISKQAVHDSLKKAEKLLNEYEEKLGLVSRLMESRRVIDTVDSRIDCLKERIEFGAGRTEILEKLDEIKNFIAALEE